MAENKEIRKMYENIRNEKRGFQARNMMVECTDRFLLTYPKKSEMDRNLLNNSDLIEDGETTVPETIDAIMDLKNNKALDKISSNPNF
ncbi:hypothetical protein CWI38_0604p0010 [Hamiltosporidium tvaerminnensis]|uniref:Uncharacterized protein n=1 Tax=Hamiltosporidium tvaerminnensis TaxID=1176355 RepID=A0A4V2JXR6_9MICR|nr:hypothetical protein CWI38_0604p0010 [Hamiltosporidium tvaerminnensis]